MPNVVLLSLADDPASGQAGGTGCGACGDGCAGVATRVPVLTCAERLRAAGMTVEIATACSDAEIDATIKLVEADGARLVVAAGTDGEVRAVLRRMIKQYAPVPSKRPADLPADRTVPDLPPIGILPLAPAVPDLVTALGLPTDPAAVAAAVCSGRVRRFDLLRNDGGSVTVNGALLGSVGGNGLPIAWPARVEVDDAVLADGAEPIIACAVGNVGSLDVDGLPLVVNARPDDGMVDVAVAVQVTIRRRLRKPTVRFEVRRSRGRAVSITPAEETGLLDDGVSATLARKRSWWVEPEVWAVYQP